MSKAPMSWKTLAAVVVTIAFAAVANAAAAAPAAPEGDAPIVPSAASLVRFYPLQLSSSPAGTVEDKQVWLAKVQGLLAGAPSLLQQSLLMSQTGQEFAANVTLLEQLQAGTIKRSGMNLRSQTKSGTMTAKALGDNANLVYNEVSPCRIMDSRNASANSGVRGPLVGNHLYSIPGFIITGQNWSQYGQTGDFSDCGLNSDYGTSIAAVALVITILNPNFDSFLGVGDVNNLNVTLTNVALNYTHGQGLSTMYIVPQGQANTIYFAMPAGLSAQIIFDVVGFFHQSDATALECVYPVATGVGTGNVPALTSLTISLPLCDAGFTLTGSGCATDYTGESSWMNESSPTLHKDCIWHNTSGLTLDANSFHAEAVCCRIPGR